MCDERGGIQFAWRAILEVDRYVLCTRPRLLLDPSLAAAATYTSDTEYVKMTHRNVPAAAEEIQRAGWCWNEGYDMGMSPVLLLGWDA